MWRVSTFEKIYLRKIFFVSTFLDWYSELFNNMRIIVKTVYINTAYY